MKLSLFLFAAIGGALLACGGGDDRQSATSSTTGTSSGGGGGGSGGGGGPSGPKCSTKQAILVPGSNIDDVAISATDVFFTQNNGDPKHPGRVASVAIRGGKVTEITASPQPLGLALTSDLVIFGDETGGIFTVPIAGGTAKKIAATKGAPTHLITDGSGAGQNAQSADATTVFFSDDEATKSVPIAGGTVKTLTTEVGYSLALDGDRLILADFFGGRVLSVPRAGGKATTLADMQGGPLYPVVAGQDLVWVDAGDLMTGMGSLVRVAPGGKPMTIASGFPLFKPHEMVFDGKDFYVTADAGPDIARVPANGGTPAVVASLASDAGLAVDDACLYAGDPFTGLVSIAKAQ